MKYLLKLQKLYRKKENISELGRSMVEMLGVLSVIGVLSIAGVSGYKFAMTYYGANEIIADVRLRAVEISTKIAAHGPLIPELTYDTDMAEYNAFGHPVEIVSKNGSFVVYVDNVPLEICRNISNRKMELKPVLNLFINDVLYETTNICQETTSNIGFQFANDLGDEIVATHIDDTKECSNYTFNTPGKDGEDGCPTGYRCGDGLCIPTDETCSSFEFVKNHKDCSNMVNRPNCWAYTCVADCSSATDGDAYCSAINPQRPICDEISHTCVECQTNADCNNGNDRGEYYCSSPLRSIQGCTQESDTIAPHKCLRATGTKQDGMILSDRYLNYYESENFCNALGKDLIPMTELRSNTQKVQNLYNTFGDKMVWTKVDSSTHNCRAYLLQLSNGVFHYAWRHAGQTYEENRNRRHALCR